MPKPIIEIKGLAKKYKISHERRYLTLRDTLSAYLKQPIGLFRGIKENKEDFWALKDISFDVKPGEVIGIIGRNGAGKTTLLKILSMITYPTEGEVCIHGRVGSLLEVGTGFHPELTGRENIYFNGSILGMKKKEIDKKFDRIVDFSGVEKFLDTAVKRFSSGMQVRLAFAVAAHLDPEILFIDEVLAVGDAEFQNKCLGRMGEIAKEGRTILFVSHNMAAVSALCSKAMVLRGGLIDFSLGNVDEAIGHYLNEAHKGTDIQLKDCKNRQGEGRIRIIDFAVFDKDGRKQTVLVSGQYAEFRIYYECADKKERHSNVVAGIAVNSNTGVFIAMLSNQLASEAFKEIDHLGAISCIINKLPFASGSYSCNLIIRQNDVIQDWIQEAVTIVVEDGDFYGTGRIPPATHKGFFIEQTWLANKERLI